MFAKRTVTALVLASFIGLQPGLSSAWADNQMGYRFLAAADADALPKAGGTLGLNVGPGEQITSGGLTFRVLRVNSVKPGAAGAQAGFRKGDQIISVDGRVFPGVPAFADYVGSVAPGRQINVDFMPAGGGPKDAQRLTATLGGPTSGGAAPAVATAPPAAAQQPAADAQPQGGTLSTGTKVAIGAAAVALFGCYKLGCFNRFKRQPATR
ncbi:MAG: PDZ domain-containing protein [Janthinobacterium lividum]